jgi:phospholipase/carboxylesterase
MTTSSLDGPRILAASGTTRSLVILLHGYGSNGDDLIGLVPHWQAALPDTAFVSPNAPDPVPGAPGGYAWLPIGGADPSQRAAGARRTVPMVEAFIDQELARHGLSEDRLALVGFSQGTMMSLQVGLRRPRPLAGIVGYSGLLIDETGLAEIKDKPPVLLIHGDADPVLPISAFHHAKAALEGHGFDVSSHVSRGLGHSIDMAGLQLGGQFLAKVLA